MELSLSGAVTSLTLKNSDIPKRLPELVSGFSTSQTLTFHPACEGPGFFISAIQFVPFVLAIGSERFDSHPNLSSTSPKT